MRRLVCGAAALAIFAGAVPASAHPLAFLMPIYSVYEDYERVNGALSQFEQGLIEACVEWGITEGAARERARSAPMAEANPRVMAALASADAVMGQTAASAVPAACAEIPQGGLLETIPALLDLTRSTVTPTRQAHLAMIRAAVRAKRRALGLPDLPEPAPARIAAPAPPWRAFTLARFGVSR